MPQVSTIESWWDWVDSVMLPGASYPLPFPVARAALGLPPSRTVFSTAPSFATLLDATAPVVHMYGLAPASAVHLSVLGHATGEAAATVLSLSNVTHAVEVLSELRRQASSTYMPIQGSEQAVPCLSSGEQRTLACVLGDMLSSRGSGVAEIEVSFSSADNRQGTTYIGTRLTLSIHGALHPALLPIASMRTVSGRWPSRGNVFCGV